METAETGTVPHPIASLEESLRRRFRTRESAVRTAGAPLTILHPANSDDLISEADYVMDERLPYWADIWPSSVAFVAAADRLFPGRGRLLELGCGAGVVSSVAARLGHDVLATDYYRDALDFARVNAWRNAGREIEVRHVDWRAFPGDLGTFDTVVACDVLYEREYAEIIPRAIMRALAPRGLALLADPGRVAVPVFLETVAELGMTVEARETLAYADLDIRQEITIWEVRR